MDKLIPNNAVIYLRTSTTEQDPLLQKKDCIDFCSKKNLNIVKIFIEQKSAFKDNVERVEWDKCIKLIKDNKYHLVVFRYDRVFRKRKLFVEFMKEMSQLYKVKVYSVSENWLNSLWEGIDKMPQLPEPFNKIIQMFMELIWNILIELIGEQAEEESRKKGLSVKSAVVRKENRKTKSKYGKNWGRRSLPKQTRDKIIDFSSQGMSIREISSLVKTTDKNNNMVPISKSTVHKILVENSREKDSNLECL